MPAALLLALLALPFVAYAAIALGRKSRYRALAARLGAKHTETGLFSAGAIAGEDFRIETERAGKTFITNVHVLASGAPGRFILRPKFFERAPDWNFAWVPGTRTERVFLWEVAVGGYAKPDRQQQEALLRWLPRLADLADLPRALELSRVRQIVIADGSLSTHFRGIVSNLDRLRVTLEALRQMRATSSPSLPSSPPS